MNTQEINSNISRLEKTIILNSWNKGYVINCTNQIEQYKEMLKGV